METKIVAEISKCVKIEGANEKYTVRGNVNIANDKVMNVESGEVANKDGNIISCFSQYSDNSSVNFNGVKTLEEKNEIMFLISEFVENAVYATVAE